MHAAGPPQGGPAQPLLNVGASAKTPESTMIPCSHERIKRCSKTPAQAAHAHACHAHAACVHRPLATATSLAWGPTAGLASASAPCAACRCPVIVSHFLQCTPNIQPAATLTAQERTVLTTRLAHTPHPIPLCKSSRCFKCTVHAQHSLPPRPFPQSSPHRATLEPSWP